MSHLTSGEIVRAVKRLVFDEPQPSDIAAAPSMSERGNIISVRRQTEQPYPLPEQSQSVPYPQQRESGNSGSMRGLPGQHYPRPQQPQPGNNYGSTSQQSGFYSASPINPQPEYAQDAYTYSVQQEQQQRSVPVGSQQQRLQQQQRSSVDLDRPQMSRPSRPAGQGSFSYSMLQQQHQLYEQHAAPAVNSNEQILPARLESEVEILNKELFEEIERKNERIKQLEKMLIDSAVGALQSVTRPLTFTELKKLEKPLISIQLVNGDMVYFDNVKPFELFTNLCDNRVNVDLKLLEGEYDCSYRGRTGNWEYFSTLRGKIIKFFRTGYDNGEVVIELVNEMKTTELSLFKNEPLYFIERSREWSVYQYNENYTESEGEKFDISQVDLLSKYERHYHRGVLYLFRESVTASITKVNEKVVRVEGPLLDSDVTSFYTNPRSDSIYVVNSEQNVIIILNTTNLTVSQLCYEPPSDATNHSIVGIHDGVLTMAFDGVWGRCLSIAKMP